MNRIDTPETLTAFTIRQAAPNDAAAVAAFAERTFVETFGPDNTPEDLAAHIAKTFGVAQQSRELRDPCITTLRGVAQSLMRAVEDAARQAGARTLWLGVWERNPRAIAFYAKCGFTDVGEQEFIVGADRQTDRVMARSLQPSPR